ncbi:MAG TPA: hypothetical protein VFB79_18650 [Candidatus Angelobacter sp.]|nr:hypothetical protein [Candidatus Angelobacter sp.]
MERRPTIHESAGLDNCACSPNRVQHCFKADLPATAATDAVQAQPAKKQTRKPGARVKPANQGDLFTA